MNKVGLARAGLLLLSGFGALAGGRLSVHHLQHGEICPMIGPIPACLLVLFGYACIVIAAALAQKKQAIPLFYLGWTPVFLLALAGVILEFTQGGVCPVGPAGIPQCFISFAMAAACWWLFNRIKKRRAKA